MGRTRSVLLILMLLAGSLSPPAAAQELRSTPPERGKSFQLEPNYPKIVVSETYIPFQLDSALFQGRDTVMVSLRIYNLLRQTVAIPVVVTEGNGTRRPLLNLPFSTPGRKMAYWDAKDVAGEPVPSGVYYLQLVVRGQPQPETTQIVVDNPRRRRTIIPWLGGRQ